VNTPADSATPLVVIRGTATDEEVAALLAALQGLAATPAPPPAPGAPPPQCLWAAPARRLGVLRPGAGTWRASALPR
jgi:hypothetical protein